MLDAGRKLDALVAEKVFHKQVEFRKGEATGWKVLPDGSKEEAVWFPNDYIDLDDQTIYLHYTDGYTGMIQYYSTYIRAAWEVVVHMQYNHFHWSIHRRAPYMSDSKILPWVEFYRYEYGKIVAHGRAESESVPHAICIAALMAIGENIE